MYLVMKVIHVLAVVAFLGNISMGVFWKAIADKDGRAEIIAHTMRGIMLADRIVTIPSIIVILLAGFATAGIGHLGILSTGWILWGLALFIISGIAFIPVSRAQVQIARIAGSYKGSSIIDDPEYGKLSQQWAVYGTIALVAPLLALILMVLKPALPAFHAA